MKTPTTKLISMFVVVFLCLNAGAFLCLAHCNNAALAAADHCPLKKASSSSCHRSKAAENTDNESFTGTSIACCMMPVGVFAAPLEKRSGTITVVPVTTVVADFDFAPLVLAGSRQIPKFYYRPPPNDARLDRVRNQLFRI
jgi:hypothetical protein